MLNPDTLVRYYGLPTERMTNNPGSKTAPTWKAVKRPNGTTDYIEQPDEDTYYRDWETDRKSTRLNSSHITRSRMPSSA